MLETTFTSWLVIFDIVFFSDITFIRIIRLKHHLSIRHFRSCGIFNIRFLTFPKFLELYVTGSALLSSGAECTHIIRGDIEYHSYFGLHVILFVSLHLALHLEFTMRTLKSIISSYWNVMNHMSKSRRSWKYGTVMRLFIEIISTEIIPEKKTLCQELWPG